MFRHFITLSTFICFGSLGACAADEPAIEGFTEPYADIELAAAEMGILSQVEVKEGDIVKAGQLLAALDDTVLQAALKVAHASRNARGQLESAIADLETRQVELEKLRELRSHQHASHQEVDRVAGEVRMATARVHAVREELEIKNLEYERIRAQLNRRQIRSTIDGVVTNIFSRERRICVAVSTKRRPRRATQPVANCLFCSHGPTFRRDHGTDRHVEYRCR